MAASSEYSNTRTPGSSARRCTPRLRTASLGVEGWAISTVGCVSLDDMQQLYAFVAVGPTGNPTTRSSRFRKDVGEIRAVRSQPRLSLRCFFLSNSCPD